MPDIEAIVEKLGLLREHLWFQTDKCEEQYIQYYYTLDSTVIDAINLLKEQGAKIRSLEQTLEDVCCGG